MDIDKESFRRMFPNLYREMENRDHTIKIDSVRSDDMKSRGEINEEYAEELLKQLKEKGLRSFGQKKEDGYYFRIAGLK